MKSNLFAIFLAFLATTVALPAAPLEQWHWRSPVPQGSPLYNLKFVNNNWMSLGEFGTILDSVDGTNWITQESGVNVDLHDCAYGAGTYVAVGDFGTLLTSPDGISWTGRYAGTFYSLKAITFADNQFVAVGENTTILTSPDGINWTPRSSGDWTLFDIIKAQGLYVAVGEGTQQGVVLTSADARTWTLRLLVPGGGFSTVAFGNGTFAAALNGDWETSGTIWESSDGMNWKMASSPGPTGSTGIYYDQGHWFATTADSFDFNPAEGDLLVSTDLLHWTDSVPGAIAVSGMASANGRIIASRLDGTFLTSTDAVNWLSSSSAMLPMYPSDLEYLNGSFVFVGDTQVAFSTDGTVWTNLVNVTNSGNLLSIAYGKGLYVAGSEFRTIWTSLDAINWTNLAPDLGISPYIANVSVAYGNRVFVGAAGYEGDLLTSADGTNWMVQQPGTNSGGYTYFSDIKFGGGRFVAVGGTALATSTDGTNWYFANTNQYYQAVACGNGIFVAVGYSGLATSFDGTNWTPELSSSLNNVAFGDGFFVAIGAGSQNTGFSTESPIWISSDGVHWTQEHSKTPLSLDHIAFGDGTFVIAGADGLVLQSDPLVELAVSFNGNPSISVSGPTLRTYRIDYSDGIGGPFHWNALTTFTATNCPAIFCDRSGTNSQARFYRAVLLP